MYTENGMTYASAYCYLKRRDMNVVALRVAADVAGDYEEGSMERPIRLNVGKDTVTVNGWFAFRLPKKRDYAEVKMAVIRMRYSNDDQLAIILNKDRTAADAAMFLEMQKWREFAAEIAAAATAPAAQAKLAAQTSFATKQGNAKKADTPGGC
ncbi:MAG: hypothetical protein HDR98_09835 [Bacteroides sp.]|nr:hypothetical protein [Bacteroides sp.]